MALMRHPPAEQHVGVVLVFNFGCSLSRATGIALGKGLDIDGPHPIFELPGKKRGCQAQRTWKMEPPDLFVFCFQVLPQGSCTSLLAVLVMVGAFTTLIIEHADGHAAIVTFGKRRPHAAFVLSPYRKIPQN